MVQREQYEAVIDLAPFGLFGDPAFDGISVIPPTEGFHSYEVINAILFGDDLPYERAKVPVEIELSVNEENYSFFGNKLTIRIVESLPGSARSKIEMKVRQFVRRLSFVIGKSVTFEIKSISRVPSGALNPIEYTCKPYAVYDRKEMTSAVTRSLTEFDEDDMLLLKSMDYFRTGELFMNIWGMLHSDEHFRHDMDWKLGNTIMGTAFLNFWKPITIITEELGSAESEIRLSALGLNSKNKIKTLQSLRSLRNDFDIAHREYDSSSINEPRHFISVIKTIAQNVIEVYNQYSKKTGKTFRYKQDKSKYRHANETSFLEKEYEKNLESKSKLDFGWAISKSETLNS